jgi:hypothetical protein
MNGTIQMTKDPPLLEVAEQDRELVKSVIRIGVAMNKMNPVMLKWVVKTLGVNYVVQFVLTDNFSLSVIELEYIKNVSLSRISNIVVTRDATSSILAVHVLKYDQPIIIYESDVFRVMKRARYLN